MKAQSFRLSAGSRTRRYSPVRRARRVAWALAVLAFALTLTNGSGLAASWVEQGAGPIINGPNTRTPPDSRVAGAINAIAIDPDNANLIYVGTVNGGIWKTTNATAVNSTWIPLTDFQLPALSIRSLAISPVNPNLIFAGSGSSSSLASLGSLGFGVARSPDGGDTWSLVSASTFTGKRITSIVPTALGGGNVVFASTDIGASPGVYLSTDGGDSFTFISGRGGLPAGSVSSLVADPGNVNRLYAALPTQGIFRTDNSGLTWIAVNNGLSGLSTASRILLSVHNSLGNNVVYAAVINTISTSNIQLSGVFRSTNLGDTWLAMGVPSPPIHPGGQGNIHGAIAADPVNPNVVFIAGDRQDSPFPNSNGCSSFSGNTFRGDASLLPGNPWQSLDCNSANAGGSILGGTSPHADSRAMIFDATGDLLQASDGGIFRLVTPNAPETRKWASVNGNMSDIEAHSAAYDPLSNVVFAGTQDNGTPIQITPGSLTWNTFQGGDGGNVAVDSDQIAHPGTTIRYTSSQNFGSFRRSTWNASNTLIGAITTIPLNIVSGPGAGRTLFQFDPNIQFYNPFVLNTINPSRMLIGTASIYESMNRGDSLANLGFTGFFIGDFIGASPMAYGGRRNGIPNPDVFYVGAGATIRHRVNLGDPIITLSAYPGSSTRGLVMNPQNYEHVFVLDNQNRVWGSFNEGASWTNLTANLSSLTTQVHSIEIFSPDATIRNMVLLAGGLGGVFQMRRPGAAGASWTPLSTGLPHALVRELHYDYIDDVLVAAIMGRGVWTLTQFFRGGGGIGVASLRGTDLPAEDIVIGIVPSPEDEPVPSEAAPEPEEQ
jgi:hypothetical protein